MLGLQKKIVKKENFEPYALMNLNLYSGLLETP